MTSSQRHTYVDQATALLGHDPDTLLLYGSRSRGDAKPDSDVDLLSIVASRPRTIRSAPHSLTCYTAEQLTEMVGSGSLFTWHLKTEGVVLRDRDGVLSVLEEHPGVDEDRLLRRVSELSVALDASAGERERHGVRLAHIGGYLLRTAIYALSRRSGYAGFNLDMAATSIGRPELAATVQRRGSGDPGSGVGAIRAELATLIGPLPPNPHGSVTALAVEAPGTDAQLAALAIQCLLLPGEEIDYATLPIPAL